MAILSKTGISGLARSLRELIYMHLSLHTFLFVSLLLIPFHLKLDTMREVSVITVCDMLILILDVQEGKMEMLVVDQSRAEVKRRVEKPC